MGSPVPQNKISLHFYERYLLLTFTFVGQRYLSYSMLLSMEEILHQLIGSLSHCLGFYIPGGCLGFFPPTVFKYFKWVFYYVAIIDIQYDHSVCPNWSLEFFEHWEKRWFLVSKKWERLEMASICLNHKGPVKYNWCKKSWQFSYWQHFDYPKRCFF